MQLLASQEQSETASSCHISVDCTRFNDTSYYFDYNSRRKKGTQKFLTYLESGGKDASVDVKISPLALVVCSQNEF